LESHKTVTREGLCGNHLNNSYMACAFKLANSVFVSILSVNKIKRRLNMKDEKYDSTLTQELLRLVEQSVWANRQWIEFVYSQVDPEIRPQELLCHLMVSDRIWFERIAGGQKTQVTFPVLDKEELLRGLEENRQTFQRLIATRMDDVIHFRRASGEEYHARVVDIIYQLLTHGYHHRGQLAAHYARKAVTYPNTDHINFLMVNRL
jgi:uncharacterized damage-inducible protein DinB